MSYLSVMKWPGHIDRVYFQRCFNIMLFAFATITPTLLSLTQNQYLMLSVWLAMRHMAFSLRWCILSNLLCRATSFGFRGLSCAHRNLEMVIDQRRRGDGLKRRTLPETFSLHLSVNRPKITTHLFWFPPYLARWLNALDDAKIRQHPCNHQRNS